jgi:hypothetical protein
MKLNGPQDRPIHGNPSELPTGSARNSEEGVAGHVTE